MTDDETLGSDLTTLFNSIGYPPAPAAVLDLTPDSPRSKTGPRHPIRRSLAVAGGLAAVVGMTIVTIAAHQPNVTRHPALGKLGNTTTTATGAGHINPPTRLTTRQTFSAYPSVQLDPPLATDDASVSAATAMEVCQTSAAPCPLIVSIHGGCGVPAGHGLTQRSAGGFGRASLQVRGTREWTPLIGSASSIDEELARFTNRDTNTSTLAWIITFHDISIPAAGPPHSGGQLEIGDFVIVADAHSGRYVQAFDYGRTD